MNLNERVSRSRVKIVGLDRVLSKYDALRVAEMKHLDLVEVNIIEEDGWEISLCRLMDYQKYVYEKNKGKKHQKTSEVRTVKLTPTIDEHDLARKIEQIKKFVESGDKVQIQVVYRGRNIVHMSEGAEFFSGVLDRIGYTSTKPTKSGTTYQSMVSK